MKLTFRVLIALNERKYARRIKKVVEPEVIASGRSRLAYFYARYIIKGRFPLGEPVIATDALNAFSYARFALKAPFPLGEPVIAVSEYAASYYLWLTRLGYADDAKRFKEIAE